MVAHHNCILKETCELILHTQVTAFRASIQKDFRLNLRLCSYPWVHTCSGWLSLHFIAKKHEYPVCLFSKLVSRMDVARQNTNDWNLTVLFEPDPFSGNFLQGWANLLQFSYLHHLPATLLQYCNPSYNSVNILSV